MDGQPQSAMPARILPGYLLNEALLQHQDYVLYRARRRDDGQPVIVKLAAARIPDAEVLDALRREFEVGHALALPQALRPLEWLGQGGPGIVFQNAPGRPLSVCDLSDLSDPQRLTLCLTIARAVGDLHKQHCVHGCLAPQHLLWSADDDLVTVASLGHAGARGRWPLEELPYIAPEATGRMGFEVDHRADLYSLGCIYYGILVGEPPFQGRDAAELIHAHFARRPVRPENRRPGLPARAGDILLQLLAKTPDERYQSVDGLIADLERLRQDWDDLASAQVWDPHEQERRRQFRIPEQLYGRDAELERALERWLPAQTGEPQWILLSGMAGVGKTALVNALRRRPKLAEARFLQGKFEQLRRHVPYHGVIAALGDLVTLLLTEPEQRLAALRRTLAQSLGGNLRVLIDVVPDLALIVGDYPPLAATGPAESQRRFELALRGFLTCLAATRPMLLFLDDLQWADAASLKLLSGLAEGTGPGRLLIVGAYRDNEVPPLSPLAVCLDELQQGPRPPLEIRLRPLGAESVAQLVGECLGRPETQVRELSDWIFRQTEGNPFFVRQLLDTLYQRGLLGWREDGGWQWDMEGVGRLGLPENVVDFMAGRLRELSPVQQEILATAACLGSRIDVQLLALALEQPAERIIAELQQASYLQLVVALDPAPGAAPTSAVWRFSHDRVQQAAYSLLSAAQATAAHLRLARVLARPEWKNRLFELVSQYNLAHPLLSDPEERQQVARLNLLAGRQAKAAAAFAPAREYFAAGQELLAEDAWQQQYALCFALNVERMECEYVAGSLDEAERLFEVVLAEARSRMDQARAYSVKIALTLNAGRPREALALGSRCLALFGIDLPTSEEAIRASVDEALAEASALLAQRPLDELPALPANSDPEQQMVGELLMRLYPAAYQQGVNPLVLITMKLVINAMQSGHPPTLAFAFINYAAVMSALLEDFSRADRFAQLALKLAERSGDAGLRARVHYIYGSMVCHWTRPALEGVRHLYQGYGHAMEAADLVYAGLNLSFLFRGRIMDGDRLDEILVDWERFQDALQRLRYPVVALTVNINRQWMLALKGLTDTPTSLSDAGFDEDTALQTLDSVSAKSPTHWFYLLKAWLFYYAGDYTQALGYIEQAEHHVNAAFGQLAIPEHYFCYALIVAGLYPEAGDDARPGLDRLLDSHLRRLATWARHAPANFAHKHQLAAAEAARVRGGREQAAELYQQARRAAGDHGFVQHQALADELAGRFYLQLGFQALARAHLVEAHSGYLRWGATGKARQLGQRHPDVIAVAAPAAEDDHAAILDSADVASATKAALALSSELELDNLVQRLLGILLESAGATRVLLMLQRPGGLVVEGRAEVGEQPLEPPRAQPALDCADCAQSVLNYALRTRKKVLVADAGQDRTFALDPHVVSAGVKSLLCLPILKQNKLLGLVYLENDVTTHAFSSRRLALLELLTAQTATSLENALLYDNLKTEIVERERAERAAREGERRWRAFLDYANLAVVSLDLDGRVEYANPHLLQMTGYSREQLIGRNWFEEVLPIRYRRRDLQAHFYNQLRDLAHTGVRGAILCRDGSERYVAWSSSWLRDPAGNVVGTVSIGEDITERLTAERELRRLHRELENRVVQRTAELRAANSELEAFAYSVSHDLRAPLRSIDGFSQALLEDYGERLDETGQDYLERVRRASQRMGSLIDAILQMSRQTRGMLRKERVDLSALAEEAAEELRGRYPDHAVELTIQPHLIALGDPRLLRVVFDNLLGNAWKYSRQRSPARIGFCLAQHDGRLAYCVRDNGVGFDMQYADRLFGTFQRLHSDQEFEGTGIGLATVQRIVHRHGGRIWAEGAPGAGAAFYFSLGPGMP